MFPIVIAVVLLMLVQPVAAASAQSASFTGQIQPTLVANELFLSNIRQALPSSDMDALAQQTATTLDIGEQLAQQLDQAIVLAPDDAARSRVEGVLTHTQAAVASLQLAQLETTADAARGRLDQARGEAQEGLDELRPFVLGLATPVAMPQALPTAGSLYGPEIATLPLIGMMLIVVGAVLRRGGRAPAVICLVRTAVTEKSSRRRPERTQPRPA